MFKLLLLIICSSLIGCNDSEYNRRVPYKVRIDRAITIYSLDSSYIPGDTILDYGRYGIIISRCK